MHACNYLSTRDKTMTTTMDNYIVMQPMPNLRYDNLFNFLKKYISNDSFLCAIVQWVSGVLGYLMHFILCTHLYSIGIHETHFFCYGQPKSQET